MTILKDIVPPKWSNDVALLSSLFWKAKDQFRYLLMRNSKHQILHKSLFPYICIKTESRARSWPTAALVNRAWQTFCSYFLSAIKSLCKIWLYHDNRSLSIPWFIMSPLWQFYSHGKNSQISKQNSIYLLEIKYPSLFSWCESMYLWKNRYF